MQQQRKLGPFSPLRGGARKHHANVLCPFLVPLIQCLSFLILFRHQHGMLYDRFQENASYRIIATIVGVLDIVVEPIMWIA